MSEPFTLPAIMALELEPITQAKGRDVIFFEQDGERFYIKRYWRRGKGLRKYWGRSRARAEWENLSFLQSLGLSVPEVVFCEEVHKPYQAAYVMRAIPNAVPLNECNDRTLIRNLIQSLAYAVKHLHDNHFIYHDLFARNILVSDTTYPHWFFIDCPAGSKKYWPFFNYFRLRDLGCLLKEMLGRLSRTDCLRFYLAYTGESTLRSKDKTAIRRIVQFAERKRFSSSQSEHSASPTD